MKKVKRLMAALLTVAVATGGFVGCGQKQDTSGESTTGTNVVEDKGEEKEAATVPGQIGSPNAPVNVSILIKDVPPTEEGVIMLKEAVEEGMAKEDKYVTLEFLEAPTGTYGEVVPLALRTGEMVPDLVYFQGGDLPIAQEGLLEDLTPYIENSPNIQAIMQDHHKEKMANYPYLLWLAPARVQVPLIRKDWAEQLESAKLVMEDPTVDNYYTLFKELKDTGLATYGTSVDGGMTRLDSVFNHAFGITGAFVEEDGKWVSSMATEGQKEKLAFYNKLYTDGLLDPEYVTTAWDVLEQKFYEGTVGMISGTQGGVVQIYNDKMVAKNGPEAELVVLPPAKGVGQAYISVDTTKESRGFAILEESEVKDAAFAILDFMASEEGRKIDKLGIEGVHYNVADGKIEITDRFSEWWARFWDTLYKFDPGMSYVTEPFAPPTLDSLEATQEYYHQDANIIMPEELQGKWDAMVSLYKEYSTDIIRGVKPVSEFDTFVEEFNKIGGDEIAEYVTGQFQ